MKPKKLYANDFKTVRKLAEDIGKTLVYLQGNQIYGYCECGNSVQVFCESSYVDLSNEYENVTGNYVHRYSSFTL